MSPVAETASSDRFEARRRFISPLTRSGETSLVSYQLSQQEPLYRGLLPFLIHILYRL